MTPPRVLVDSSIWVDHLNKGDPELAKLLRHRRVLLHPMIVGEIALGSLQTREATLAELKRLPQSATASHMEVMAMIEWAKLYSAGIGYVDAHLLAALRLETGALLWTRDNRLHAKAALLKLAYD